MEMLRFLVEQIVLGAQWGIHATLWFIIWIITVALPFGLGAWTTVVVLDELQYDNISIGKIVRQVVISLGVWPLSVLWSHYAVSPISTGHVIEVGSSAAYWAVWGYPAVAFGVPTVMLGITALVSTTADP